MDLRLPKNESDVCPIAYSAVLIKLPGIQYPRKLRSFPVPLVFPDVAEVGLGALTRFQYG
ncbi:hypothetical protein D3C76_1671140 [compost metagenome]